MQIETWMADGYPRSNILQFVRKEEWGIANRTVDDYIGAINRRWDQNYKGALPGARARAIKKRERLYLRALKKDDVRTALAVQDSADKIAGIIVDKVEETRKEAKEDMSKYTDDQLRRIAEIKKEGGSGSEAPDA